jgi:hypothetical protein
MFSNCSHSVGGDEFGRNRAIAQSRQQLEVVTNMANRRPADFRFPTEKQDRAEATARNIAWAAPERNPDPVTPAVGPDPMPEIYRDAVLADLRGHRRRQAADVAGRRAARHRRAPAAGRVPQVLCHH